MNFKKVRDHPLLQTTQTMCSRYVCTNCIVDSVSAKLMRSISLPRSKKGVTDLTLPLNPGIGLVTADARRNAWNILLWGLSGVIVRWLVYVGPGSFC